MDLPTHIQDFIDSAIPKLRSQWAEVRGSAAIVIGIKHLCDFSDAQYIFFPSL